MHFKRLPDPSGYVVLYGMRLDYREAAVQIGRVKAMPARHPDPGKSAPIQPKPPKIVIPADQPLS